MKIICLSALLVFLLPLFACAQTPTFNGLTLQDSSLLNHIPAWVKPVLEKSEIAAKHKIIATTNPFYFEADFSGDKLIDIVFWVENTIDHSKGLMIINSGKNLVYIIGCGNPTEFGSSLTYFDGWFVFRDKTIRNNSKKMVSLKTPGIKLMGKKESNMVVYWAGKKYKTMLQK